MKKSTQISLIILSVVATSCKTYLTPAGLGHEMAYVPKPMLSDDNHVKTYISGGYGASASPSDAINFEMGMLNINRSHTLTNFNFSYGVFGYLGNASYTNTNTASNSTTIRLPNFKKNASGLGIRTSIGFHDTSSNGNTDYRLISWDNSISREMGDYAEYRSGLSTGVYDLTYISRLKTIWSTGFSTEIIFHSRKNKETQHAFRLYFGGTPGLRKSFDRDIKTTLQSDITSANVRGLGSTSFTYFLKIKKFSFTYDYSTNVNYATNISLGYIF